MTYENQDHIVEQWQKMIVKAIREREEAEQRGLHGADLSRLTHRIHLMQDALDRLLSKGVMRP